MKRSSKKISTPVAQLRKIGIVPRDMDTVQRADLYWRGAHRFIPRVMLWITACSAVALAGALACLFIVFSRPRPILLVSLPDGITLCAMPPVDPQTGKPIARPSAEEETCKALSTRAGRVDDAQNLEFSQEVVKEDTASERPAAAAPPTQAPLGASEATPTSGAPTAEDANTSIPHNQPPAPEGSR